MPASKRKYSCFTEEQQAQYDSLNIKMKKYVVSRAQGHSKSESYRLAGYKASTQDASHAATMEGRFPFVHDLIKALTAHKRRVDVYYEDTPVSKEVDKKAEEEMPPELEMTMVNASAPVEQKLPELSDISGEEARRISFYRKIANGSVYTTKETKTFDKDGNLVSRKVEKVCDLEARMKARKELDSILGLKDMLQIGNVEAGDVNIMIVDTGKAKEITDGVSDREKFLNDRGEIELDDEIIIENDEVKN